MVGTRRFHSWVSPGKDCGLCGAPNCETFGRLLAEGAREAADCPFTRADAAKGGNGPLGTGHPEAAPGAPVNLAPAAPTRLDAGGRRDGRDVLGNPWDFVLTPLPGEPSARKIVLPFRPDLVEKWRITRGDIVLGRPAGAGCPVQHVLRVIRADHVTGVLETWVVGPRFARDREVRDVVAYHMLGFEGLAAEIRIAPVFGARHTFLPGFCMMHLGHTGLVNMILDKSTGLHVRIEDIRLLAGPPS